MHEIIKSTLALSNVAQCCCLFPQLFSTSITLMCKRYYAVLEHKIDKDRLWMNRTLGVYEKVQNRCQ